MPWGHVGKLLKNAEVLVEEGLGINGRADLMRTVGGRCEEGFPTGFRIGIQGDFYGARGGAADRRIKDQRGRKGIVKDDLLDVGKPDFSE